MENKKLIFGDPESIKIRDKAIEECEKKEAPLVDVIEDCTIVFYNWQCPNCMAHEEHISSEEIAYDGLIKCYGCKKWLKLNI